ncbi:DUF1802 family protein [Blastopirellula sp. JC732]|uniref:DUF1802 family protein n=1 Tax=Blastopirellula sediminis TaxID=2894196 RepID=A0A9X1MMM4_9BACT|nr:DUF1802 family protein [Blastopirellula sediminis]MCC9607121.1 DUF1802 family protein [Blastopirellula sediminis]MCC9629586.1 DUF1802 family protein [Blastopirellula sediminis]
MNATTIPYAIKEWDVVCEALRAGRQHLLLRKGGIQEEGDQFRAEHDAFWFWPTRFHQSPDQLNDAGQQFLQQLGEKHSGGNRFAVDLLAQVDQVRYVTQESKLAELDDFHILSADTVRMRYHYREPSVYLFLVRIYTAPHIKVYVETPEIAGCKSWIDLPEPPSAEGVKPVLTDEQFAAVKEKFEALFT